MCGIVGIVADRGQVEDERLQLATRSLAHRGPDDSGTVILRKQSPAPVEIGLGNRRLAILDLSPLGHQPMEDRETGNWLVYNGELYNFREIREELQRAGIRFSGHSDTEVLLRAYGRWGEACLPKLRGIFVFAVWDNRRNHIFLARDPMGVKPLYYASRDGYFLFASEVRTLLTTGLVARRIDRAGLLNYLAFGSVYDPLTLIEGVLALPPAHFLTWQPSGMRLQKYWELGSASEVQYRPTAARRREVETELRAELEHSVELQTVSDVPVGVFLSGGIDSSVVAAVLARKLRSLKTFSLVFNEPEYSEGDYARLVAKTLGSEHHELLISEQEARETIPATLRAMDQPTVDGLNTYLLSGKTRAAGIKVALSGLGGDELFAGYSSFRTIPRMERFLKNWNKLPRPARGLLSQLIGLFARETDQHRKLAALTSLKNDLIHPYFVVRMLFSPRQQDALLSGVEQRECERFTQRLRDCLETSCAFDSINRVCFLESRCYMANTLLRDSDVMSMAHGLEMRVPLADHHLAQRLMAIPGNWKLHGKTPKPLLARSLAGMMPANFLRRAKKGFTLPLEQWLRGQLRVEVKTGLQNLGSGPLGKLLQPQAVAGVWQDFEGYRSSWSRPWSLYVLERWCELHSITA
ncbi:MAG: asparagine synthase (glutamine-hydrolyzing) [Acidobacteria bacterium]|nr:asparagine synthase (glutamine-hydrolyzing) [Acidobacteriota bacterium]